MLRSTKNSIEEWRDVVGCEGRYQVSNFGNVRSLFFNRLVSVFTKSNGYKCVTLHYKRGKHTVFYIHRLVAQAFLPNPDSLPQINHKDENKANNNVDNLEWCTCQYNVNYGTGIKRRNNTKGFKNRFFDHEKMSKRFRRKVNQYSLDGTLIKQWSWSGEAVKALNLKQANSIRYCCRNEGKTAHGYVWRYAEG